MGDLSRQSFERVFGGRSGIPMETQHRAAVAALLRFRDPSAPPSVLLMRRAEHPRDRWSGHVALPGGREDDADPSLFHTALRETQEEVGLDLTDCARYLGSLDAIRAVAKGRLTSTSILPHVFVEESPGRIEANHEVARTFWLPLGAAASGELDAVHRYEYGEQTLSLPCWRYDGETVWGLTHRMLRTMIELARLS